MSKTIKVDSESQSGLHLTRETIRLQGGPSSFFYADGNGCSIVGPISILEQPENIRIGIDYVLTPIRFGVLPSTSVNPTPVYLRNQPTGASAELLSEVTRLLGELI